MASQACLLLQKQLKGPCTLVTDRCCWRYFRSLQEPSRWILCGFGGREQYLRVERHHYWTSRYPLVQGRTLIFGEIFASVISESGFFNAIMTFPSNYPNSPPAVRFTSEIWHPNVYPDGRVCISILHPPGDDPNGYELASERWMPIHTVESIVLSIISMLSSPNDESPANVEAAKEWRERRDEFKRKVSRCVRKSQEML